LKHHVNAAGRWLVDTARRVDYCAGYDGGVGFDESHHEDRTILYQPRARDEAAMLRVVEQAAHDLVGKLAG